MRRARGVMAGLVFFSALAVATVWASDFQAETFEEPEVGPVTGKALAKEIPDKQIVQPFGDPFLRNRVDNLERRMRQLEHDLRYLEERTRSLDRSVTDLRNRH